MYAFEIVYPNNISLMHKQIYMMASSIYVFHDIFTGIIGKF